MVERKSRPASNPYEIWYHPQMDWAWAVLKGYKKPENNGKDRYDRYFCAVSSDITREQMSSGYEMGDVYITDVMQSHKVWAGGEWLTGSMGLDDEKKAEILGWFDIS